MRQNKKSEAGDENKKEGGEAGERAKDLAREDLRKDSILKLRK